MKKKLLAIATLITAATMLVEFITLKNELEETRDNLAEKKRENLKLKYKITELEEKVTLGSSELDDYLF